MNPSIRDPYDAFVCRAWKAAQLAGTEQYLLLAKEEAAAPPFWSGSAPCFSLTAALLPPKAPFSNLSGSFCDLGALPLELDRSAFTSLLQTLLPLISTGSSLVFQYSSKSYPYRAMEKLLSSCGCLIYEHLEEEEIRDQFLLELALMRPQRSVKNLCYCLAVKHRNNKR